MFNIFYNLFYIIKKILFKDNIYLNKIIKALGKNLLNIISTLYLDRFLSLINKNYI